MPPLPRLRGGFLLKALICLIVDGAGSSGMSAILRAHGCPPVQLLGIDRVGSLTARITSNEEVRP